jgi:hypothetical protein
MDRIPAAQNRSEVSTSEIAVIALISLVSLPGYAALALALVAELYLRFLKHSGLSFPAGALQAVAELLRFVGQITHLLAVGIALVVSCFAIGGRAKGVAWAITVGGILAWMISGWMIIHSS